MGLVSIFSGAKRGRGSGHVEADYVFIGGGSAGCVLANRLSADPRNHVVLVEAGGNGKSFLLSMPAGFGVTANGPGHSWHYSGEAEPAIHGRRMLLPRGKGLGGSSNINGLLYVRGNRPTIIAGIILVRLAGAGPMLRLISARVNIMRAAVRNGAGMMGLCASKKSPTATRRMTIMAPINLGPFTIKQPSQMGADALRHMHFCTR